MSAHALGLIELGLVFGGVLGWAVWELVSVRRSLREDERRRQQVPQQQQEPQEQQGPQGHSGP